jgi:hypothetical protein
LKTTAIDYGVVGKEEWMKLLKKDEKTWRHDGYAHVSERIEFYIYKMNEGKSWVGAVLLPLL